MNILGVSLPGLSDLDGDRLTDFVQFLEAEGFAGFYSTESNAHDGFTVLAHAARATRRLRLGSGILPIYTRTPTVMGQSWLTLDRLSGGRATVGLGVSSPAIVERWNGVELRRPLRAMREYVEALRAIFTGGKVDYAGEVYRIDGLRPGLAPVQERIPIFLAALNPKMLRLAGEIGDGVLLNLLPPEEIPNSLAEIERGIARAGRRREDVHVALMLRACMTDDRESADQSARMQLLAYAMAPQYRAMFARHGFAAECDAIHARWQEGDRLGAVQAVSDRMVDALFAVGDRDKVLADIQRYLDAGVDSVQLQPFPPLGHDDGWAHAKATLAAVASAA